MGWCTYVWVMFSIILRNNIPRARTQEYECENARKGRTDADGGGRGGGGERETEQISCIQISRVAAPCALLLLAWPGTAWQNKYAKASNQTSDPPTPILTSQVTLGTEILLGGTPVALFHQASFFPVHK